MNKNELSLKVFENLSEANPSLKKSVVVDVVEELFEVIKSTFSTEEDVTIQNFGKWSPTVRKARKGRNPKTGEELSIPEKKTIKFSLSSKVKKELN